MEKKAKKDLLVARVLTITYVAIAIFLSVSGVQAVYDIVPSNETLTFENTTSLTNLSENPSWSNFSAMVAEPYEDAIDGFFYVFLLSMPVFMICIRQENIILGLVTGMILSVGGFVYIPAEFRYITVLIIAATFTFLMYTVFKTRN